MNYKEYNSKNLFSLYKKVCESHNNLSYNINENYEFVINIESVWPNCVFNFTSDFIDEKLLGTLNSDIKKFNIKPIIITEENSVLDYLLKKNGFLPVDFWDGMYVVPAEPLNKQITSAFEAGYVDSNNDLNEWLKLVEDELFSGNFLSAEIFTYLIKEGNKLLYIKLDGMIIATSMIYRDDNNIDGIYMVCVRKSFRGKGYGKLIMNHSLRMLHEIKSSLCILQSTRIGSDLYKSIGFIHSSRYNLFMKIK